MKERETEKKDIINNLFILNLKYVNNYSEFIADSLSFIVHHLLYRNIKIPFS